MKIFFPARRVSGDFYDAFMLPGGYAGLFIGDVGDKPVPNALDLIQRIVKGSPIKGLVKRKNTPSIKKITF